MRPVLKLAIIFLLLTACSEAPSVEQQIITTLRNMEFAAEDGDHFDFISYVSDTFSGQQGSMDRRDFHRFMIFQINQNRRLQAQFFPIFVKETGENAATADFRILVTGGAGLLPDRGRFFQVETAWSGDNGDWLLESANWKPLDLPVPPLPGDT